MPPNVILPSCGEGLSHNTLASFYTLIINFTSSLPWFVCSFILPGLFWSLWFLLKISLNPQNVCLLHFCHRLSFIERGFFTGCRLLSSIHTGCCPGYPPPLRMHTRQKSLASPFLMCQLCSEDTERCRQDTMRQLVPCELAC